MALGVMRVGVLCGGAPTLFTEFTRLPARRQYAPVHPTHGRRACTLPPVPGSQRHAAPVHNLRIVRARWLAAALADEPLSVPLRASAINCIPLFVFLVVARRGLLFFFRACNK